MSQAHGDAETYARVLEHAPILKAPAGYVPGPGELDGVVRVGAEGWAGFIAPGADAAQFIASAVEPFLREDPFDRDGLIERLQSGSPPALGDGGRALDAEEAQRIVDVCDLLVMIARGPR
jgi:hypothetical protein